MHRIVNEPPPPLKRPEVPHGLDEMIIEQAAREGSRRSLPVDGRRQGRARGVLGSHASRQPADSSAIPDRSRCRPPPPLPATPPSLQRLRPRRPSPSRCRQPPGATPSRGGAIGLAVLADPRHPRRGRRRHADVEVGQARAGRRFRGAATALGDDASAVGAAIDAVANDVRLRAQGVASTPMLRAAIETDAATLQDMVHDGALFKPAAGEVVDSSCRCATASMFRCSAAAGSPSRSATTPTRTWWSRAAAARDCGRRRSRRPTATRSPARF